MTSLPSPIEPKGRLRHLCFTPKVPRLQTLDHPGSPSAGRPHNLQQLHGIDSDILLILHDTNDAAGADVVDDAASSSKEVQGSKPARRRVKKKLKPEFEVESFLPENEVVFQLEKLSGLRVTKDVVPALMETIKKFNILSIRFVLSLRAY